MAIPLPTAEQLFPAGGQLLRHIGGINDYRKKSAEAEYAPYNEYANAMSKISYANYLPFQIQAQVMSNPMLWQALKDNPEAMQQMVQQFSQSVPSMNAIGGGAVPMPGRGTGNSLLGMLLNKMGLSGQGGSQNPMTGGGAQPSNSMMQKPGQSSEGGGSPLVPSMQGGVSGILGNKTAPFQVSPYKGGALLPDPNKKGNVISVPTSKTSTTAQNQILAAKRVEPQLERLAEEWKPFLDLKGKTKLYAAKGANFVSSVLPEKYQNKFGKSDLPSKYAKAISTTKTAPEGLIKAYGLNATNETLDRLEEAIHPMIGENEEGYKNRIRDTLNEIKAEQTGQSEKALTQGFSVPTEETTPNKPSKQNVRMVVVEKIDDGQQGFVPEDELERYEANGYRHIKD